MTVSIVYLISGETLISGVEEVLVGERLIGYRLHNPHRPDIMMDGMQEPGMAPGPGLGSADGAEDSDNLRDLYGGHGKNPMAGDPSRFLTDKQPLLKDKKLKDNEQEIDINLIPWQPLAKEAVFTIPADKIICVYEPVRDLEASYLQKLNEEAGDDPSSKKKKKSKSVKQILNELEDKTAE